MYRWEGGPALVQTVDFFTPIVDDPYVYGQIAAANALSDVYAMGGRPLTALAIAGFPKDGLDRDTIRAIFQGGFDKLREAGVALLGGHTVRIRKSSSVRGHRRHRSRRDTHQRRREARRRSVSHQAARHRHRRHRDQVRPCRPRAGRGSRAVDADVEP